MYLAPGEIAGAALAIEMLYSNALCCPGGTRAARAAPELPQRISEPVYSLLAVTRAVVGLTTLHIKYMILLNCYRSQLSQRRVCSSANMRALLMTVLLCLAPFIGELIQCTRLSQNTPACT
jgi:hypothetical protein